MDQLSEEVRQESPWTMMFADDIVICSESREQVEENVESWRFALERRGMKVSRSKTEYMCVNEREGSGTVRLQGEEVKKVQEFKYLGSTVQSNGECGKEPGERIVVKDFRKKNWKAKHWLGPFQILLTTPTTVKIAERAMWIHASHCKWVPVPSKDLANKSAENGNTYGKRASDYGNRFIMNFDKKQLCIYTHP
ncbi:hypothetical protein QTP70_021282 [Hemibagrus guttatus]|uniref:ribonuclease H n=1 Tax=Hemibagrus guttatus TaxID=175788 RepID=A0AAE0RA43_9TELE|nr:hypothetical protein QTP70_021282 [Hemibagrus guttatus]